MRIAIVGAHRTGKSTIAASISKRCGIPYIASSASSVARDMGVNLKGDIGLSQRIEFQHRVLGNMASTYEAETQFITDRSPLDAAAYMLADATNTAGTHKERASIAAYVEDAMRLAKRLFDLIILIQPGIPYIDEPGKPPHNEAYQEHIHYIINGMLCDDENDFPAVVIPRKMFDHRQRVDTIEQVMIDAGFVAPLQALAA